jgi:hypothetical protein
MTTAPARKQAEPAARPSAIEVFTARVQARALLWQAGEFELHEAVEELQAAAARTGLVERTRQDEVQRIMAEAFAAVRYDPLKSEDMVPDDIEREAADRGVDASTLQAAEYLVHEGDVDRLHKWLARHSAEERAAITRHFARKGARHANPRRA